MAGPIFSLISLAAASPESLLSNKKKFTGTDYYDMGIKARQQGDWQKETEYFQKSCALKVQSACYYLSVKKKVIADETQAGKSEARSPASFHPSNISNYDKQAIVKRDELTRLCDNKSVLDCQKLAAIYEDQKNLDSAILFYEKACLLLSFPSCHQAVLLIQGQGDNEKATRLEVFACYKGDPESCQNMAGQMTLKGEFARAQEFYQKKCNIENAKTNCQYIDNQCQCE